jgi:hypothetical protein
VEGFHHQQMRRPDLEQVQVDELWLRMQRQVLWVAMAVTVGSRLWLGAVCRRKRDKKLAEQILTCVYNWAKALALVISFDGWNVYFDLCLKIFSEPIYSGRKGRPAMKIWEQLTLVQVVKHTTANTWAGIQQDLWGSCTSFQRLIERTQGAGGNRLH